MIEMTSTRMFITCSTSDPEKLSFSPMDARDLKAYKIKGNIGEVFYIDREEPEETQRIVGEITGHVKKILEPIFSLLNVASEGDQCHEFIDGLMAQVIVTYEQSKRLHSQSK